MTTLERTKLPECTSELIELASKATKLMSYNLLQKEIKNTPLVRVLRELEIEPFTRNSVVKYQQEMLEEKNRGINPHWWNRQRRWEWQRQTLRDLCSYSGPKDREQIICNYFLPIPEFVLAKAVSIIEKLPQVRLMVETLSNEILYDDPFLIARLGWEEEFYIEVWNEPKFEGKL